MAEMPKNYMDFLTQVMQMGFQSQEEPNWLKQIKPEPINKERLKKTALVSGIASLLSGLAGLALAKGAGLEAPYAASAAFGGASLPLQATTQRLAQERQRRAQQEEFYRRAATQLGMQKEAQRAAMTRTMVGPAFRAWQQEQQLAQQEEQRKRAIADTQKFLETLGLPTGIAPALVDNPRLISLLTRTYGNPQASLRDYQRAVDAMIESYNERWSKNKEWYEIEKQGKFLGLLGGREVSAPTPKLAEAIQEFEGIRQLANSLGYDLKLSKEPFVWQGKEGKEIRDRLAIRKVPLGYGGYDMDLIPLVQQLQQMIQPQQPAPQTAPPETGFAPPLSTATAGATAQRTPFRFPEAQIGGQFTDVNGNIITAPTEKAAVIAGQLKQRIDSGQLDPGTAYADTNTSTTLTPEEKEYIKAFIVREYYSQ